MQDSILFLGTGASAGVPVIGCKCAVCTSQKPKNHRLRPSALLTVHGKKLLIDVGPDFRTQALRAGIDHVDGLLLTHTHYDHIAGIDDLRIFSIRQKKALPCLLSEESFTDIQKRYYYFSQEGGSQKVQLDFLVEKKKAGSVTFLGIPISFFTYEQLSMQVMGFRIGDLAYVSDIKTYSEDIFSHLDGVKTLILSALRPEESSYHLSFREAASFAEKAGAKQTFLTHLGHFHDHEEYNQFLPEQVRVAYDGLELEFSCKI